MRCSKCGSDNREGRKFCTNCGTSLIGICPKCGAPVQPGEKFCGDCGAPIGGSEPAAASSSQPGPLRLSAAIPATEVIEGERKTVTALFADLKGSTELMESLDPEEARALIDPALKIMVAAVGRYEGYVVQSTGDGIFALFGAPAAYEDHPQRGVYAALQMQHELREYAQHLANQGKPAIEFRVGINTGEVVVRTIETGGKIEYAPIGHTANLASRLQTLAPAGSIAVSEHTRSQVEGYFDLRALGPLPIRGINQPVNIYEATGLGPLRTHFQLSIQRGLTKFVGRERELAIIERSLELAMSEHGQVVAVVADAGTGKSRLFYEFKAMLPPHCQVLEVYSISHGKALAWLPVIELLRSYFGIEEQDEPLARREKIRVKLEALDPALRDMSLYLFGLLGILEGPDTLAQMDPQVKRQRTLDVIKRIILRESLVQPLVLIFEDLHWIDSQTQALLDLLADSIVSARVLLMVNYRPEYRHEWSNTSYYSQLRLEPLDNVAASEMLTTLLGDNPELGPLRRLIIERTEGNPFFIEEMLQALFDEGVLARNGVVKIRRPFSQLRLPSTIQGILAARIDRQPAEHKQLLQTLAVIGREAKLDLIGQIFPTAEPQLHQMLSELQTREFIYEQPAFPQTEYVFKHVLTQEVAYNSMLVEQRKALHECVGQALESMFSEQLNDHVSELARHYRSSGNTQKAPDYSRLAGQQAVRRSALTEAISHLTTALELLRNSPDAPERAEQELALLVVLGPALMEANGYAAPEVERVCARARVLCQQMGDARQLMQVLRILWGFYVNRGPLQTAHELAGEMLSLTHRDYNAAFQPDAHYARGLTSFFLGDFVSARDHTQQAIALYESRPLPALHSIENPKLGSLGFLAWALWFSGCPDQAISRIEQALVLSQELPRAYDRTFAVAFAAWLYQFCRQSQAAESYGESALALSNEYGFPFWLSVGRVIRGWVLSERGKSAEGITQILEAIAAHQATGAKTGDSWSYALSAEAYERAGRVEEGLEALTRALATMHSTGESFYEAEVHRLKGELLAKQDASEARICLQRAIDVARKQRAKSLELRATMSLARLLAREGRRDEALSILADIYNWFTEGFDTTDLKEAKALLEELDI